MIYPYVGDFLLSPIPLQLSFNFCSHKCSYCFANLNNPNRTFDLKEFQAQLKGIYTNNSLPSQLLREQYPVIVSNLVDPFATSNYGVAVPTIEMLSSMGIPVAIQTRGGRGVDDVLHFLPRSVWYISIPFLSDNLRQQVEPGAPSIGSRLALIEKVKAKGHPVVVGINPTIEDYLPGTDGKDLIDVLATMGVSGIWLAAMHFNQKQLRVMPAKDRERIGESVIQKGLKNARGLQQGCYDFITGLKDYAHSKGLHVEGLQDGGYNDFFGVYKETYPKHFPTFYDFINWCHVHKLPNEPVYYQEFEEMMLPLLIGGKHNVSPYMRCMSAKVDDEIRSTLGYKQSFQWLLNLCWNEPRMKRTFDRFFTFAVSVNTRGGEMDYNRDKQGNKIYHFNPNAFSEDFYLENEGNF